MTKLEHHSAVLITSENYLNQSLQLHDNKSSVVTWVIYTVWLWKLEQRSCFNRFQSLKSKTGGFSQCFAFCMWGREKEGKIKQVRERENFMSSLHSVVAWTPALRVQCIFMPATYFSIEDHAVHSWYWFLWSCWLFCCQTVVCFATSGPFLSPFLIKKRLFFCFFLPKVFSDIRTVGVGLSCDQGHTSSAQRL